MAKFEPFEWDTRVEWDINTLEETLINDGFIDNKRLIEILKRQEITIKTLTHQIALLELKNGI